MTGMEFKSGEQPQSTCRETVKLNNPPLALNQVEIEYSEKHKKEVIVGVTQVVLNGPFFFFTLTGNRTIVKSIKDIEQMDIGPQQI